MLASAAVGMSAPTTRGAGTPVLFNWQLYRHREVLHLPGPRYKLSFLYAEYSQGLWWYEIVELIRKLLLWYERAGTKRLPGADAHALLTPSAFSHSGVVKFMWPGSATQVLTTAIMCTAYILLMAFLQPFQVPEDNLISLILQVRLSRSSLPLLLPIP